MRAHRRERFHLPNWVRGALYGVGLTCVFTGSAWLLLHHFVRTEGEFGPAASPFEHPALILHGIAAAALLWLFGLLWLTHVRRAWQRHRNRRSGGMMVALMGWLALSGLGLYYLADEQWRTATSIGHWSTGLLAAAWLPIHIWRGRRALKRQPSE